MPSLTRHGPVFTRTGSSVRLIILDKFLFGIREVFLRELISNANDALEKFRLTSLTNKDMWDGAPLNITIKPVNGSDGSSGRIIITGLVHPIKVIRGGERECDRQRHWDDSG